MTSSELTLIRPEWPAPVSVRAVTTTRLGGTSGEPWASLNLGDHVGDDPSHVAANRTILADRLGIPAERFGWLNQVHGTHTVKLPLAGSLPPSADASVTFERGQVCAILTADCLPVLFCDAEGSRVAAAHAGWRGLCNGVLEQTVAALGEPATLMAWLGPAIGPASFEVGPEVRDAFVARQSQAAQAFAPVGARPGHYLADIYQLARLRLQQLGVTCVYGGNWCTVREPARFFSFRRDGQTGRMASVIWLN
ncbi:peptidoglycan editing factor PgeF [Marinobacter caseinilyticus]|uniref:peptidoglycan editing factor PgeF n=1 Tax=Marinobacter caseinilyticus TaxID=2692195 RepID=UPI001A953CA5|nr:peptidoglycan editing factor PgeF [Marinobacter caseinilyticus]